MDVAGRYGGEEFFVILPEISIKGSITVAQRIREEVERIKKDNTHSAITISIGAAEYNGEDIQEIVKRADQLLYKAKEHGRNCIESWQINIETPGV